VLVNGPFTAVNGPKSAAVPHPDGSHRRLYCQESPEPWFEDFGKGRLANGRADVRLDADFAAVVHSDDYHVFLTEYGDSGGLYVANLAVTGFEVRARAAAANGAFGYRVVVRRKDIPGPRLEKVSLPELVNQRTAPPDPTKPHNAAFNLPVADEIPPDVEARGTLNAQRRADTLVVVVLGGELAVPCNRQPAPAGLNPHPRLVRRPGRPTPSGVDGLVLRGSDS